MPMPSTSQAAKRPNGLVRDAESGEAEREDDVGADQHRPAAPAVDRATGVRPEEGRDDERHRERGEHRRRRDADVARHRRGEHRRQVVRRGPGQRLRRAERGDRADALLAPHVSAAAPSVTVTGSSSPMQVLRSQQSRVMHAHGSRVAGFRFAPQITSSTFSSGAGTTVRVVSAARPSAAAGSTARRSSVQSASWAARMAASSRTCEAATCCCATRQAIEPMRRAPSESAAMPATSTSTGFPVGECAVEGRREHRLERLDPAAVLEPGRDAGDQPAAADADERAIGQAGLVLDFGRERAGAGHDLRLVVGVHQQRAALLLALQARLQRLGIAAAADRDAGAELGQLGAAWPGCRPRARRPRSARRVPALRTRPRCRRCRPTR